MDKDNDNGVGGGFQFTKRDTSTKWQKFQRAIYDPSTKQFLGRTSKNWGQLLMFYTIFYIVLAALFAICMQGLFATLNEGEPKWKLDESIIGTNPGLGFRPISKKTEEGSLISYNVTNQTTIEKWVSLVDEFLEPYKRDQVGENFAHCNFSQPPPKDKVCSIHVSDFGNCTPENAYGYNSSSPCVFLKLNRIFGWKPEFYTEPHKDMPEDLKTHINNLKIKDPQELNQVWVSCVGEGDVDKESVTTFDYNPRGFAGYFYPYQNSKNYLSPLIAVSIRNPKPNIIISIECRAWAKNIEYIGGSLNRQGSVKFEVMVETETRTTTINPITASD